MKRVVCHIVIFCLFAFPVACECKTVAYSPSIPGQPLIFHSTTPSSSENTIAATLSSKNRHRLLHLSKLCSRLSEELLGLVENASLPHDCKHKASVISHYNARIDAAIDEIYRIFRTLEGPVSKPMARLIKHTLIHLTRITHEMVANPHGFQQDSLEMQQQVINFYTVCLEDILSQSAQNSVLKADAVSALEGVVSCLTLLILNTDSLVNHGNSGQKNFVLARQQINKNLTMFVEATFALQARYDKCE